MLRRAINFIKGFHYTRKMNTQKKCNIHWHTEIDTKTQFEGCNTECSMWDWLTVR